MWHPRVVCSRFETIFFLLIATVVTIMPDFIQGLKNVSVTVPKAIRQGDNALLICNYDMENDTLYSVKWYRGRREFYRYTPKENPSMKTFPAPGINVERLLSNQSHLVLVAVPLNVSGKFSCEVSVDSPSFDTAVVSGEMKVVAIPVLEPIITGIHSRYRLGDIINGNCTLDFSKPAANISWTINDVPVPRAYIKSTNILKNPDDRLETSISEINFLVTQTFFIKGRLKLKCIARIYDLYERDNQKFIEEDRPRILASGRSPDLGSYPYEQDGSIDDKNELYLTHKDMASSSSSASSFSSLSSLAQIKLKAVRIKRQNENRKMMKIILSLMPTMTTFDMILCVAIIMVLLIFHTNGFHNFQISLLLYRSDNDNNYNSYSNISNKNTNNNSKRNSIENDNDSDNDSDNDNDNDSENNNANILQQCHTHRTDSNQRIHLDGINKNENENENENVNENENENENVNELQCYPNYIEKSYNYKATIDYQTTQRRHSAFNNKSRISSDIS